ncbi:MAG TPA: tRNA glutamyl-Q(34) synthetase GluQRS [Rhodanobacteraceae bacterium]|nr:tRNA glutamyl-Q(34) synthetase GluQRS [Rhodanobacteraceae bacterium]
MNDARYVGRFAPSPTGHLHFGSLVAALGSWLRALQAGGRWLLRIEDIDPPREVAGSADAILAALDAFGLQSEAAPIYQSSRSMAYGAALERLQRDGHAFPCWCSRAELDAAGILHQDGRCISPVRPERAPAWRLRAPDRVIAFTDGLAGGQMQNLRDVAGDFVLKRADGLWSYQLACVVDDAFQGITEVVRGADLLDSTPRQIHLQRCLDLPTPRYLHLPLARDAAGRKLSKSDADPAPDPAQRVATLHAALRFLGQPTPHASNVRDCLAAAAQQFDLARVPRPA